jgi:hypothetical protein
MKTIKLLVLLTFISVKSQTVKIDWYKEKIDDKTEILGNVKNETIGLIKDGENISYTKISSNGTVTKKVKLPFKFNNIDYTYINTILTKNSVIVLIKENREKEILKLEKEILKKEQEDKAKGVTKEYDEKLKLNNLRKKINPKNTEGLKKLNDSIRKARLEKQDKIKQDKINEEKEIILAINIGLELNVTNKPIKIKGIKTKDKIKKYGLYSFSNDSTKILIYNQFQNSLNEQIKFSFTIINENLSAKEKDTLFEVPMLMVNPEKTKFSKIYLDNNNNILGVFKEIRSIENNNSNFFYKTLIFDNITFKPRAFDIDYEGDIIDNLEIFPQENNEFLLVGFLAGIKKGIKFSGKASVRKNEVFLSKLNSEQKTLTKIFNTNIDALYPYNNLKITNYMPYKSEYITENSKGEYVIIAHQINKKSKTNTINPGEEINYDNNNIYYGDVSIIKINKKGILTYNASISKYQSPANKNPMMLFTYKNEKLITIFEDNLINNDVDTHVDPWTSIRNNENKPLDKALFITSVDENRVILKNPLYEYKKNPQRASIKKSIKLNNNTFLLIGNNNIGKLTIE